jgi:hypothetical protein
MGENAVLSESEPTTYQEMKSSPVAQGTEVIVRKSSEDVEAVSSLEIEGELRELEENMLASLRRKRKLMKKIGIWEQRVKTFLPLIHPPRACTSLQEWWNFYDSLAFLLCFFGAAPLQKWRYLPCPPIFFLAWKEPDLTPCVLVCAGRETDPRARGVCENLPAPLFLALAFVKYPWSLSVRRALDHHLTAHNLTWIDACAGRQHQLILHGKNRCEMHIPRPFLRNCMHITMEHVDQVCVFVLCFVLTRNLVAKLAERGVQHAACAAQTQNLERRRCKVSSHALPNLSTQIHVHVT